MRGSPYCRITAIVVPYLETNQTPKHQLDNSIEHPPITARRWIPSASAQRGSKVSNTYSPLPRRQTKHRHHQRHPLQHLLYTQMGAPMLQDFIQGMGKLERGDRAGPRSRGVERRGGDSAGDLICLFCFSFQSPFFSFYFRLYIKKGHQIDREYGQEQEDKGGSRV